ncbi:twin-arginine translocase subunit TatC [Akkermansia glycaniphila]|uniref:twin-arginine translocase subunit TatC n=1 Tax=Akkermansia glycaniphila TaxID=1679444 RepID=UPI001C02E4E5|nr:twin-arginine translocase subunit TatC [Akkermansia glycaniphila]
MFYLKHIFRLREKVQIQTMDEEKPFLDHLDDLRKVLMRIALTLAVTMLLCFQFAPALMDVLRYPADQVWTRYETSHLPSGITVDDWTRAKQLSGALPELEAKGRRALLQQEPEQIRHLAQAAAILRASGLLPENRRDAYIREAAETPAIAELATTLQNEGAILRNGSGHDSLKLMGAFQPGEAFMLSLKMSFYGGLVISFPLLMFFLLQFIVPGLLDHERRLVYKSIAFGFGLFLAGCTFAYFVVLPRVLSFFYEYSIGMGIENDWRIGYYLAFATKLVFMFGITFELPVLVIPFVKLGILTYELMSRTRTYAIAAILILALILAPTPDPATMLIMALPMYLLYEFCIFCAWLERNKRMKQLDSEL